MKISIAFLFLMLAMSCSQSETKKLDFKIFEIQVPAQWRKIKISGTDSEVGAIVTKENDTIYFDYGAYSNSLEENPIFLDRETLKVILEEHPDTDTTDFIIVDNMSKINIEDYKLNTESFVKISGFNAKIISPKKEEKGITGVYIDSLGSSNLGKIKFNLHGKDLNLKNQNGLLKAIKTIKFKN